MYVNILNTHIVFVFYQYGSNFNILRPFQNIFKILPPQVVTNYNKFKVIGQSWQTLGTLKKSLSTLKRVTTPSLRTIVLGDKRADLGMVWQSGYVHQVRLKTSKTFWEVDEEQFLKERQKQVFNKNIFFPFCLTNNLEDKPFTLILTNLT